MHRITRFGGSMLFILFVLNCPAKDSNGTMDLSGDWKMKDFTRGIGLKQRIFLPGNEPADCLPYRVPGTVRTALLEAGVIPDPYVGFDNEKSIWTEHKEWWFFRSFVADKDWKDRFVHLEFEGSSFQGEVWLNGQSVGELKGMMNPRAFDISSMLKFGEENRIAVRLEATDDARQNLMERRLTWDTPRDQLYSIAQCMYGWDWGPHGIPVGLWRPVTLRASGALRAERPYIRTRIPSPNLAVLNITVDVENLSDKPKEGVLLGLVLEKDENRKAAEFRQSVTLGPRETKTIGFNVNMRNPKFWWPNGMGDANLYVLRATLMDGASASENIKVQFGVRELKLVENEKVDEFIKSMKEHSGSVYHLGKAIGSYPWTFEINGRKMFAKGGNWIPVDQLLRLDRDRYDRLLTLAKEAHFNLLRIWGGGLYETDDFYELCDAYGILAWQEFLSNRSFSKIDRRNFLDGAESAVVRLRNHPSLTFWCGGNEFDPDDRGSKAVIDALDSLLKHLDPEREFHRASPYMGDDHYWGVWHGLEPYTKYRIVRPFRSEAGVNAFPVLESYEKFTPKALLWPPDTTFVEYHGEYNTRFQHLEKVSRYADEFGPSASIGDFISKSQVYQALANAFNMEFCRSNKFQTSGLLIWQYNDIWPCLSWSMVDWYGEPKPSYYYQKRASRPLHVSIDFESYLWRAGDTFAADVHVLNDTDSALRDAAFRARLLDVSGRVLAEKTGPATAEPNRSADAGRIEFPIPQAMAGRTFFAVVELSDKDGVKLSDAVYPVAVAKSGDMVFRGIFTDMARMPSVTLRAEPDTAGAEKQAGNRSVKVRISNPSDRIAFFVRIKLEDESEALRAWYSDNYTTLLPGESKTTDIRIEDRIPGACGAKARFEISGWNVLAQTIEVPVVR